MAERQLSSLNACIRELSSKLEEVENRFRGAEGNADLRTDPASRQGIDRRYRQCGVGKLEREGEAEAFFKYKNNPSHFVRIFFFFFFLQI